MFLVVGLSPQPPQDPNGVSAVGGGGLIQSNKGPDKHNGLPERLPPLQAYQHDWTQTIHLHGDSLAALWISHIAGCDRLGNQQTAAIKEQSLYFNFCQGPTVWLCRVMGSQLKIAQMSLYGKTLLGFTHWWALFSPQPLRWAWEILKFSLSLVSLVTLV